MLASIKSEQPSAVSVQLDQTITSFANHATRMATIKTYALSCHRQYRYEAKVTALAGLIVLIAGLYLQYHHGKEIKKVIQEMMKEGAFWPYCALVTFVGIEYAAYTYQNEAELAMQRIDQLKELARVAKPWQILFAGLEPKGLYAHSVTREFETKLECHPKLAKRYHTFMRASIESHHLGKTYAQARSCLEATLGQISDRLKPDGVTDPQAKQIVEDLRAIDRTPDGERSRALAQAIEEKVITAGHATAATGAALQGLKQELQPLVAQLKGKAADFAVCQKQQTARTELAAVLSDLDAHVKVLHPLYSEQYRKARRVAKTIGSIGLLRS